MSRTRNLPRLLAAGFLLGGLVDCHSSGGEPAAGSSGSGGTGGHPGASTTVGSGGSGGTGGHPGASTATATGSGGSGGIGGSSTTSSGTSTTTSSTAVTSTSSTAASSTSSTAVTSTSSTAATTTSSGTGGMGGSGGLDGGAGGSDGGAVVSGKWVVGYYTSWNDPANGGNYPVSAIDWDGLTHVATAFYLPDGMGGWTSGTFDAGTATSLIAAAHAKGKKALASIGGAGSGPAFEGSSQPANLATFVHNLEALLALGYDGIDLDWEGGNLSAAQDQALETSLIKALRTKSPSAILTLTAGFENENFVDDLTWYGTIAAELDQINLMTYGMSGAYPGWQSWHASPLHWNQVSSTPTGIDATVANYLAAGVPAAKLGVGAGFYGECYTAPVTAPVQMLGASQIVASDNTMSYANILSTYYSASAYHYDSAAQVPYLALSGNNPQQCTYVTYEDATSIAAKGAWVKAQGLGGLILWQISEDFVASGATVAAQNPLLEATKTALVQ